MTASRGVESASRTSLVMNNATTTLRRSTTPPRWGKIRTGILLWALGVPIPLILLFFLIRGCMA